MKILGLILGFLCGFIGLASSRFQVGSTGTKHASFERFDGTCPGHKVPVTSELLGMRTEGSTIWVNTTFTVKEDISSDLSMFIEIERCKSKENLDTCEHFYRFKSAKYCKMLLQSNSDLWGGFSKSFTPEWKCPFKKGLYRGIDSKTDMTAFLLITAEDWCWKVRVQVQEKRTNRIIFCFLIDAVIGSAPQNQTNRKS